jgi:hypothetical protein
MPHIETQDAKVGAACSYLAQGPIARALHHRPLMMIWREAVVTKLRYYPDIYLQGLRKITINRSQDSRCPDD